MSAQYLAAVAYGMPYSVISLRVLSTQSFPREAEAFHRGEKYLMHVSLPTYLSYLQPKDISW